MTPSLSSEDAGGVKGKVLKPRHYLRLLSMREACLRLPPAACSSEVDHHHRSMRPLALLFCSSFLVIGASAELPPAVAEDAPPVSLTLDKSFTNDLRLAEPGGQEKVKPDIHYVPTPQRLVDLMLLMAEVNKNDLLYDLGSGDGRLVITAAKTYGTRGIGIEIDPERIAEAKENAAAAKVEDKVQFWQQDLFQSNFKDATVITLYLLDVLNRRLRPQILAQVKPGTRLVSHAFHMGEWEPEAEKTLKIEGKSYNAYFWVVPANMSGRWQISGGNSKEMPASVTVEQQFQKFSVRAGEGNEIIGQGRLLGTEFTLTLNKGGRGKPISFTGEVDGDRIKASAPGTAINWNADREAGTLKPLDSAE